MSPIDFDEANGNLEAPALFDESCQLLPCYRDEKQVVSCWHISLLERIKLLFTGQIWLGVAGSRHPPVWLDAHRPFEEAVKEEKVENPTALHRGMGRIES